MEDAKKKKKEVYNRRCWLISLSHSSCGILRGRMDAFVTLVRTVVRAFYEDRCIVLMDRMILAPAYGTLCFPVAACLADKAPVGCEMKSSPSG